MARVDDKALERAGQALNARISSGDWPGATREIIETYLDEAERSKAPDEAIERACIAYWGEHTFFRIFGEKSRRGIREAMRRAATELASDPQEVAENPEVRTDDLASQLRWFSAKKKWPKGLEGMPELLAKAADALAPAEPPPALSADEVLSDVKNFAHWHHLNEWTVKNGRTPSDSEIDFEVEAYRKIERAIRAYSVPCVQERDVAEWQLVPKEPTEEMEKAGRKEAADCDDTYGSSLFSAGEIYRAMIAAAPAKQDD
jgi:hypothetical protein